MVQVDIFWSYGLASGLAVAASPQIKRQSSPWVSKYFVMSLLWIAVFFAPSGIYLLWRFPYWETMFLAKSRGDIPAWLVTLFAITNVTQGVLGYYVTWRLLHRGKDFAAKMQPVWSHLAMLFILVFGWDGSGLKRFTYRGTGDEWARGVVYPMTGFFGSPVFYTLCVMALLLVPSYVYLIRSWRLESRQPA